MYDSDGPNSDGLRYYIFSLALTLSVKPLGFPSVAAPRIDYSIWVQLLAFPCVKWVLEHPNRWPCEVCLEWKTTQVYAGLPGRKIVPVFLPRMLCLQCIHSWLGLDFFGWFPVLNVFPSIFHGNPQVLNVFLHMFLIAPHFYTICFAQSCPLLDYIAGPSCIRPNFRTNIFPRDHEVSDFCILWANQNGSLQKWKLNLGSTPSNYHKDE